MRGGPDRALALCAWLTALAVAGGLVWVVGDVVRHGAGELDVAFLVEEPRRAGREGGILPVLVSTLAVLATCLAVAVPLGLATAVLLAEFSAGRGTLARLVRPSLDVLAGVPSIVFGLFGNAFFCVLLGLGYSILAGGLTLACMVLPILIRSIELGLRSVPDGHRLAGAALSVSRTRLLGHVLLPAAAPGLAAGLVLGIGRALAETAALLFTSGYVDRMPASLLDSGRVLSIHVYDLAMNVPGGEARAYASALVLVLLLVAIGTVSHQLVDRVLARRIRGT